MTFIIVVALVPVINSIKYVPLCRLIKAVSNGLYIIIITGRKRDKLRDNFAYFQFAIQNIILVYDRH